MTEAVLDASAIIALIQREPGGEIVRRVLRPGPCAASAVNIAEVSSKLTDHGVPADRIEAAIQSLQLEVVDFTLRSALAMTALRTRTRRAGLSLADRACIELGERLGLPIVTTDRVWTTLDIRVPVILARLD